MRVDGWLLTPEPHPVRNVLGLPAADRAEEVLRALRLTCRERTVRRVEFPSAALALRCVQAQRAGLALEGVTLALPDEPPREVTSPESLEDAWCAAEARRGLASPPAAASGPLPSVTVCVPHFNHGAFLPDALASIAAQDHPDIEVVVLDDGSTDEASRRVFDAMERRYPRWRFVRQANAGIGATRNRGLAEARGEMFLPVDADNVVRSDMASTLARAMQRQPEATALTCYFLAFESPEDLAAGRFAYACRPSGGPFALACHKNVYGDACGMYRTEALRAAGGWAEDRGTSFEDWELFVKLAGSGHTVGVVPEHLFYYRHLASGFSRVTDQEANRRRVQRRFREAGGLPGHERELVYAALSAWARGDEARGSGGWRARMARWFLGGGPA
jgi:GT2 family glycosyltransferase